MTIKRYLEDDLDKDDLNFYQDDLHQLILRHSKFVKKLPWLDKFCLRYLTKILENLTSQRYLEDVLVIYL